MQKNYRKAILNILLFLAIAIGCVVRIYMCIYHFTSCDDLGVAMSMLNGEGHEWSIRNCVDGFLSFRAFGWTYAPLQFIVTCILLSPQYSYLQTIVIGRIPSLFFGVISLFIFYRLCASIWQDEEEVKGKQAIICSLILLATSFENIIYSAQMESYAIGVAAVLVCLFLFVINVDEFKITYTTVLVSLLCYAQYQLFIFVFCFYAVMFFKYFHVRKTCRRVVLSGITSVVLNIPNLHSFFDKGMGDRGLNWNIGFEGQFLYDITTLDNFGEIFRYTVKFFINNVLQCYKYLLLPCKYETIAAIIAAFLVILTLIGLLKLHKGNQVERDIGYFIDAVFALYLVLILKGTLTLSPSRHLLVMVPVILICICAGFIALLNKLTNLKYCDIISGSFYAIIIILFMLELPDQINDRTNRFDAEYFENVIKEYDADFVITYGYSMDAYLLENVDYIQRLDYGLFDGLIYKKDLDLSDGDDKTVIFFSNSSTFSDKCYDKGKDLLDADLQEMGCMAEYQLIHENTSEERWGATQEYAGNLFPDSIYGEYIYGYRLKFND